jgi:hypothetical protein
MNPSCFFRFVNSLLGQCRLPTRTAGRILPGRRPASQTCTLAGYVQWCLTASTFGLGTWATTSQGAEAPPHLTFVWTAGGLPPTRRHSSGCGLAAAARRRALGEETGVRKGVC